MLSLGFVPGLLTFRSTEYSTRVVHLKDDPVGKGLRGIYRWNMKCTQLVVGGSASELNPSTVHLIAEPYVEQDGESCSKGEFEVKGSVVQRPTSNVQLSNTWRVYLCIELEHLCIRIPSPSDQGRFQYSNERGNMFYVQNWTVWKMVFFCQHYR